MKVSNGELETKLMKHIRILSIILSASLAMGVFAGCQKDNSEEPVIIYYSEGQEGPAATVTLQNTESGGQTDPAEPLGPILADRTGTETSATTLSTAESETSATAESETSATESTGLTEATTTTTQEGNPNVPDGVDEVPVISSGAHVYDEAGVIGDEGSVNSAMSSFESSTGVSPAIFTIRDSLSGDDFRQYARDIYSSNFSDQDHVLVVYQLTPQNTWSWTCVFGSNTGTVFDQDTINTFQSDLTNAFSSGNVDNALVSTFNNAQSQDG
jgi:hypothetical protein